MRLVKIITLTVFIQLLLNLNIFGQQPTQEWVKRYSDTSLQYQEANAIQKDAVGNLYVLLNAENSFGFIKYDNNGNQLSIASYWPGGYDNGAGMLLDISSNGDVYIGGEINIGTISSILIVKFNSNGNFQWSKIYNSNTENSINDMKLDYSGNLVVAGVSRLNNITFAALLKYNPSGDTLWTRLFTNISNQSLYNKITIDSFNNIYSIGYINSPLECLVTKYGASGNQIWAHSYAPQLNSSHIGYGIDVDVSGNIYILITADVSFADLNNYLVKLNNFGTVIWSKVYMGILSNQGRNSGIPRGPVISSDGGSIYFSTMSSNGLGGGSYSIATVKYNSNGDSQWVNVYGGGNVPGTQNRITKIRLDNFNNIYICGSGYYSGTGDDLISVKYSPSGVQLWTTIYSGLIANGADGANDILVDSVFNVYVCGKSKKSSNTSNVAVTIKYSQTVGIINSGFEIPSKILLGQNYPNPFNPKTKIKFSIPYESFTLLKIYDVLGRVVETVVNEQLKAGTYEAGFDGSNLASGVYFYTIQAVDPSTPLRVTFSETKKLVLVK